MKALVMNKNTVDTDHCLMVYLINREAYNMKEM